MNRIISCFILLLGLLFIFPSTAFAFQSNLKTSEISQKNQDKIWNNLDLHISTEKPEKNQSLIGLLFQKMDG